MKLQFKHQQYQLDAVNAVADCFNGEPFRSMQNYFSKREEQSGQQTLSEIFANPKLTLSEMELLTNIQQIQLSKNLPKSDRLIGTGSLPINLDIEMETGTGKTYCYIRTIFELNRKYGWSKFIIVVPSIAIREGVKKSFEVMATHFQQDYGKKARHFIYNSKRLHELESFAADSNINVMIINIQAFNAGGKDNRRIYEVLDSFQSRQPIEVIAQTRPILILDEPQKMEGKKTQDALAKFKPLFILRYSATHKTEHNKIYRLDAVDAFHQKLVKKIAVKGIQIQGLNGLGGYLYLQGIEISKRDPVAVVEIEQQLASGEIKRKICKIKKGDSLHTLSNGLAQYQGWNVSDIDARTDQLHFLNGIVLAVGDAVGDLSEEALRRIQIRETIKAHLLKERILFTQGIKTLSLFFIDEVAKYRDYTQADEKGEYARMFEQEYATQVAELLAEPYLNRDYADYLQQIQVGATHNGYFAIDNKTKRLTDPSVKRRGEEAGLSDDTDAYDLILKDKEKLLSFEEPTRFIFSHSALREGWDNPNVFTICLLKHSDNNVSRRQEVGRGLRLAVNKKGERQDNLNTVHQINELTVVANESYTDFVKGLQSEISETLSRLSVFNEAFFVGKVLCGHDKKLEINEKQARLLYKYLLKNDFVDDDDQLTPEFHSAVENGALALPAEFVEYQAALVALICRSAQSHVPIENTNRAKSNPLNANFNRKEFQALWQKIHHKAVYQVNFDSQELISNAVRALERELNVMPLTYRLESGEQIGIDQFKVREAVTNQYNVTLNSKVKYDLVGTLAKNVGLTRKTIAVILKQISSQSFAKFALNPEQFISEASRLIKEQLATIFIDRLSYHRTNEVFDTTLFTAEQTIRDFSKAVIGLKKHIYDYAVVDSQGIERNFVEALDKDRDVVVYAKLPRGFAIPTPVGDYNPDWAISFMSGEVKHTYFIAETKGSISSMDLRGTEKAKIECARKFFQKMSADTVHYDVVKDFEGLISLVK
ncbi:type III restriction enzyme [Bibersteinia trehalosi]|uniref:type III restriction-modification system endonuclease n=1 Tax=Bibersteinia trehalosi TaxID=47735 RepID=UPI0010491160|nr:DEAD/DEAH box helicase family protein [Bibersteinia trehalosi]TCT18629.1 type III restriction enzyme [Bibersteinia trehalosi]